MSWRDALLWGGQNARWWRHVGLDATGNRCGLHSPTDAAFARAPYERYAKDEQPRHEPQYPSDPIDALVAQRGHPSQTTSAVSSRLRHNIEGILALLKPLPVESVAKAEGTTAQAIKHATVGQFGERDFYVSYWHLDTEVG